MNALVFHKFKNICTGIKTMLWTRNTNCFTIFVHRNFRRKCHSDCEYHIVPRPRKWGLRKVLTIIIRYFLWASLVITGLTKSGEIGNGFWLFTFIHALQYLYIIHCTQCTVHCTYCTVCTVLFNVHVPGLHICLKVSTKPGAALRAKTTKLGILHFKRQIYNENRNNCVLYTVQ